MLRTGLEIAALAMAAPALAAPPPASAPPLPVPAPVPVPRPAERPDSARIAAAERLIAVTMPAGYFRETLAELMPSTDTILAALAERLNIDTADMSREERIHAVEERGRTQDRHFRERLEIMLRESTRVTGEVLDEMEPELRRVTVTLVARQFDVAEIDEMTRFFGTPAGQGWVRMSMRIGNDPAYQEMLAMMGPRMLAAQQRVDAAIREATAHLDPVPQS